MEREPRQYWEGAHEKYSDAEWIHKPTMFAESVLEYFPSEGKVLDAGCGQGQDSRFFASKGYEVIGIDFASEGIARAIEKTSAELKDRVTFIQADLAESLPFPDAEFDVVHCHLAAHYFSSETTQQIMKEFARVLKRNGVLTLLLNSVHDSEYGNGERIEDDYFVVNGIKKRYFSADSLKRFTEDFETEILDESGETFKDRAVGNSNLVRFVGRKK
ncbi:class I SAM-dependent methyltransferase [Patescibacteria group bacterium]|nr:class I SAM-dependent methyltransferase [Patescibacteria group bacterium]MBU1500834.1 class I SAM-dependent methyltransferase [Patescibacteria group bacterium]MBU2080889.1 class I SAM-dependent methyltransferase [Patescibacteria group bacterium]MBU2123994.1 class I SAM-dependent methyltransferase [Patescibacteria group bacterium]MBU2194715.1 class I SAM-dependent methyltransferase [Patescibacteria group bacterium]